MSHRAVLSGLLSMRISRPGSRGGADPALGRPVDDRARDPVPPVRGADVATSAKLGIVPWLKFPMQPVDPREVGRVLAQTAEAEPSLAITQFAGPEVLSVCELARRWRQTTGSHAVPVRLP